jgi:hypothetical protein
LLDAKPIADVKLYAVAVSQIRMAAIELSDGQALTATMSIVHLVTSRATEKIAQVYASFSVRPNA